jgi:hypothetical protein
MATYISLLRYTQQGISSAPLARTSSEGSSRSFPDLGGSNDGQLH